MMWSMKIKWIALSVILLLAESLFAQVPAKTQTKSILLLNGTAHIGNGKVIPRSAVGFTNGKIDMVLAAFDVRMDSTKYDTIIHINGKHLYPGFIAPNSRLGLVEVEAVRATRDFDDVGEFSPHVRSIIAYNTESRISSTVRTNGVLYAQVTPKGGVISGSSSLVALDGWNWEDAALNVDDGIHLHWPNAYSVYNTNNKKEQQKSESNYAKKLERIQNFFEEAKAYYKKDFHLEKNLRFEAMAKVFDKNAKIYLHTDDAKGLTDAIYFLDNYSINTVVVGGYDAYLVSNLLKDRNIPVLLRRVHSLPKYQDDEVDLPFKLAFMLKEKGLLVGLQNSGRMEAMGTRNLPFYAGTTVAYGVNKEQALKMISLNTAQILGVSNKIGSIEVGKHASFFVSEGDALDMRTNKVILAYIDGKLLDLDNPQKQLYRKYRNKK